MSSAVSATPDAPPAGSMLRRLVRGTLNYGLGALVPQLVGFLLIPLYTAVLSPHDYGVLDLAGALGGALVIVMRVGVPGAVGRFYYEHPEGVGLRDYVTTVMIFLTGGGLVVGALTMLLAPALGPVVVPGVSMMQIFLVALAAFLMAASEIQRRLIQAREQSAYSAKLSVARGLGEIGFALLFVLVYRGGATGMLLASAIAAGLFFVQALHYLRAELRGRFNGVMLRESLVYATSVLPSHVIGTVAPLLTRSLLAHKDSVAAVGTFGIAMRFASPLRLVTTAFSSAYLPVYFAVRKDASEANARDLTRASRTLSVASVFLALGAAVIGPPVIRLMTPAGYHGAAGVIPILALDFLAQVTYILVSPELFYAKRPLFVPLVSLASAIATCVVAVFTSESLGPRGMALSLLAGSVAAASSAGLFARRLYKMPHHWLGALRLLVVGAAAYAVTRVVPPRGPWAELAVGAGAIVGFVAVLWLLDDPGLHALLGRRRRGA